MSDLTSVRGVIELAPGAWGRGEVRCSGGRVVEVRAGEAVGGEAGPGRWDFGDRLILPGAVDAHVHCLSHDGEGVAAATSAAAAGGVTTIVEMPFDLAGPINTPERLFAKQELVSNQAVVDVALLGTLAPGGGWRQAEALAEHGVAGFKVSLFDTDPNRFPRIDDAELLSVMSAVAEAGRPLCVHAENNEIVKHLLAKEGQDTEDPRAHARSRPPVSETLGVLTAMEIAADRGAALHLCHLSLGRSLELAHWYQGQGCDVTMETCPHYLMFTEDDLAEQGGLLKINPPLRSAAERTALWSEVAGGGVTLISSDHAPWPLSMKTHEQILRNHSGVPGVETLTSVTLGGAYQKYGLGEQFARVVHALTKAPAWRFGFGHRKGSLAPGLDADIMVFDPNPTEDGAVWAIDGSKLHSNAGWSPYDGHKPGGRVVATFSRGQLVYSAQAGLTGQHGRGELVVPA